MSRRKIRRERGDEPTGNFEGRKERDVRLFSGLNLRISKTYLHEDSISRRESLGPDDKTKPEVGGELRFRPLFSSPTGSKTYSPMSKPLLFRKIHRQLQRLNGQNVVVVDDSLDDAVESEEGWIPESDVRADRCSSEGKKEGERSEHLGRRRKQDGRWGGGEGFRREGEEGRRGEGGSGGMKGKEGGSKGSRRDQ